MIPEVSNLEKEAIQSYRDLLIFTEEATVQESLSYATKHIRAAVYDFLNKLIDLQADAEDESPSEYADDITPEDYEHFCADILNDAGWDTVVTKGSGDHGIDVVAEKDDFRLAIQCKKYSKPVGNKAVQEAYSGGAFYEANACAVVAPIEYTPAAVELADSLGVHLLHHDDLAGLTVTSPDE